MSDLSERTVLTVNSQSHSYEVVIGLGVFDEIQIIKDSVIVADSIFKEMFSKVASGKLIFVDALEANKNLSTVESIIIELQKCGVRSNSTVVAVGGGIIQDLMTMTASIYMRGISWLYVPTTLLGMVDSCVGGKSSINTRTVKNLIGNIYPPAKIYIDTKFLATLSETDILCGLAEASKICFCKGEDEFEKFLELADSRSPVDVAKMVSHVLSAKRWFIEIDEFDKAERKILNFGHTFGHALEVGSSHKVPHGLAVASGIKAAIFFEAKNRAISKIESDLFEYESKLTDGFAGFIKMSEIDWSKYSDAFDADKKHTGDEYSLLLPNHGGGVRIEKFKKSKALLTRVVEAQTLSISGAKL
jgi:3-dehydroquinate synthase